MAEASAETAQEQPNRGKLRRSAAAIRNYLSPIAAGAGVGVGVGVGVGEQARIEAAELIDKITSAITG